MAPNLCLLLKNNKHISFNILFSMESNKKWEIPGNKIFMSEDRSIFVLVDIFKLFKINITSFVRSIEQVF